MHKALMAEIRHDITCIGSALPGIRIAAVDMD